MIKVPKAITLDNFGTVIDGASDISNYFIQVLNRGGATGLNPKEVQTYWEDREFDSIKGKYRPYRQILKETLSMTFEHFGCKFTNQDLENFVSSAGRRQPFPDSRSALMELKKYTKIVLISNTDNDIIAESVGQIGVEFDDIVTSEMAGMYKPGHDGFHLARKRLGLEVKDILHAGFGFKYDMIPATALGYETCWINRQGDARPDGAQETYLCGDLRTLALIIKGMYMSERGK